MGFWDRVREAVTGDAARKPSDPVSTFGASDTVVPTPEPGVASGTPAARSAADEGAHKSEPDRTTDSGTTQGTYTVRSGDTLSEIGAKFGVAATDIARINKIRRPELIYPGQDFKIPGK